MVDALSVWGSFAAIAVLIALGGYHLSVAADAIAEHTGLGRNWIGMVMLATVTSLPELISGVSAVTLHDTPDLAIGNVLGSCVFNLTMLVLLDSIDRREGTVFAKVGPGHLLSSGIGVLLLGFVGFALVLAGKGFYGTVGPVGGISLALPILYLVAIRMMYCEARVAKAKEAGAIAVPASVGGTLRGWAVRYALAACVVVGAGLFLPGAAKRIVEAMGWNEAFVGTLFLAIATTLPELSVSVSAVSVGALELAFSNLLGSNLFNLVILAVDDLLYAKGPLLAAASPVHVVTVFTAIMMTALVTVALIHQPKRRVLNTVSVVSLGMLVLYVVNAVVVFRLGG